MTDDQTLKLLGRLVGTWTTEATHPMVPGTVVHGTAHVEWLEGERFILFRATTDHPDFPDSLSVIGDMARDRADDAAASQLGLQYFDSRGVFRECGASITATEWRWWRDAKGFSQTFTGTFADEDTIVGQCQLREDDVHWKDDLAITYRRQRSP
ncbi:MAG: hypothetical protein ABIY52_17080 [Gemmatimonadaceae bacterium]